ncbi:MAG: class I SAM-dependent methyltransferase, partial [Planctomycetia bacterium]|nr:class I SAM-dependent methyltransferase [Planctomycetia bacterium]
FERDPFLGMLLLDGHRRALQRIDATGDAARRLTVRIEDASDALSRVSEEAPLGNETRRPDAILIDPMFPEGKNKAAVKKDAVLLRMLVGEGADTAADEALLKASLAMATWRVAVKRPLKAPKIVESPPPQATFKGKSVRIDRYRCL